MPFWERKKKPSNFVIFNANDIVGGKLSYEDVPKYLGAIDHFRAQGATEMADNILQKMLDTGHPSAMAKKAENLLLESDLHDKEAVELFEKAVALNDGDALMKYGTWILRGRVRQDKIDDAFDMLKEVAKRGHSHLIVAAPAYYLKQIVKGIDHKGSNIKLNEWLEIWNPKAFKKYKKGKISQQEMLAQVALEAGLKNQGD